MWLGNAQGGHSRPERRVEPVYVGVPQCGAMASSVPGTLDARSAVTPCRSECPVPEPPVSPYECERSDLLTEDPSVDGLNLGAELRDRDDLDAGRP